MKTKQLTVVLTVALFAFTFSSCVVPVETASARVSVRYVNPPWAPPYYAGVRYYYFPDLELYYDLADGDFVFLSNGRWYFSRELPPFYSEFDLNNAFVISLNVSVFQPWRHHQFYISHYPRYYYRNFYRNDHQRMRGFNENERRPIYRGDDGRGRRNDDVRGRDQDRLAPPRQERNEPSRRDNERMRQDQNQRDQKQVTPPRSSRYDTPTQNQQPTQNREGTVTPRSSNEPSGRSSNYSREPQDPNYYGRKIGQPVKVERQMREPKQTETRSTQSRPTESKGRENSGGRR